MSGFFEFIPTGFHQVETVLVIEPQHKSIRCSSVEISGSAIRQRDGDRSVLIVPREQIQLIKLAYDTSAKNPFCQYFLGFTLFSLGLIGLIATFIASLGGVSLIKMGSGDLGLPLIPIALWFMIGIGFWLLIGIFRARYHLLIATEQGLRKIFFEQSIDIKEIQQFIRKAHLNFGYEIDTSILEKLKVSSLGSK
ncbi:MAG TPA: hypothetical protein DCP92_05315 [Nitrospiraceae bacterium]|jgi:hypothetical protein|nr:hypothetical protein [Nitrospiraceae bacterium]